MGRDRAGQALVGMITEDGARRGQPDPRDTLAAAFTLPRAGWPAAGR
jgi:hypothetical protein